MELKVKIIILFCGAVAIAIAVVRRPRCTLCLRWVLAIVLPQRLRIDSSVGNMLITVLK